GRPPAAPFPTPGAGPPPCAAGDPAPPGRCGPRRPRPRRRRGAGHGYPGRAMDSTAQSAGPDGGAASSVQSAGSATPYGAAGPVGPVYLDHAATTPMRAAAVEAMVEAYGTVGNPASLHGAGRGA